jgi:hypothetical protein
MFESYLFGVPMRPDWDWPEVASNFERMVQEAAIERIRNSQIECPYVRDYDGSYVLNDWRAVVSEDAGPATRPFARYVTCAATGEGMPAARNALATEFLDIPAAKRPGVHTISKADCDLLQMGATGLAMLGKDGNGVAEAQSSLLLAIRSVMDSVEYCAGHPGLRDAEYTIGDTRYSVENPILRHIETAARLLCTFESLAPDVKPFPGKLPCLNPFREWVLPPHWLATVSREMSQPDAVEVGCLGR